ncbi:S28 family serine protease [Archangium violaceum]|uniref:S28 family serine protease n=1 Tax=Archangium violaceum TaxID=83451 RepID=UPI0036DCDBD6
MRWTGFLARGASALAVALLLQACGGSAPSELSRSEDPGAARASALESEDLGERLRAVPGLTVLQDVWLSDITKDTRFFILDYEQPMDHQHTGGERFRQRMTLLYRYKPGPTPVVLNTLGYGLTPTPGQSEPTRLLTAHELRVEHRFFGTSRPASLDWKRLTIEQAAADHHRIVQALRPLLGDGRWLSTGNSKGGQAATYHRYFYPDDVEATVAYVTPNVRGETDVRAVRFLETVGTDAGCRERLKSIQRAALTRREELLPLAAGVAASTGATFDVLGLDRALEFSVLELPYYFWQVGGQTLCPTIPAPGAPASALFDFIQRYTYFTDSFGDAGLQSLAPYYYQAATQIGALRYAEHHLHGLLRYPRQDLPANLPPLGVQKRFDVTAMLRVGHWVRNSGQRMLFLYGEDDPWFSVPFEVRESNDSLRFVVPRGNHGARLAQLPEPERTAALEHLFQWAGLDPSAARQGLRVPEADTWSWEDSLEPAHRPL